MVGAVTGGNATSGGHSGGGGGFARLRSISNAPVTPASWTFAADNVLCGPLGFLRLHAVFHVLSAAAIYWFGVFVIGRWYEDRQLEQRKAALVVGAAEALVAQPPAHGGGRGASGSTASAATASALAVGAAPSSSSSSTSTHSCPWGDAGVDVERGVADMRICPRSRPHAHSGEAAGAPLALRSDGASTASGELGADVAACPREGRAVPSPGLTHQLTAAAAALSASQAPPGAAQDCASSAAGVRPHLPTPADDVALDVALLLVVGSAANPMGFLLPHVRLLRNLKD